MSETLVTIQIAAYKSRPEHLSAALQSVLAQTWKDLEVIVSDDSPDASLREVVRRCGDSRVRYRHNVPRLGVAANHWACFREARGDFVAVLNHDDLFAPTFVERLTEPLCADPELALAFCDHWVIDAEGRRMVEETDRTSAHWGRTHLPGGTHRPFYDLFAAQTIPMVMGAVFRRQHLPVSLPEGAGPAYDLWLAYLLCREGRGAYYVPERLSNWRAHAANLTSQGGADWSRGVAECWEAVTRDPALASIRSVARGKAALALVTCAVSAWRNAERRRCCGYALRAVRMKPTWKGLVACLLPLVPSRGVRTH